MCPTIRGEHVVSERSDGFDVGIVVLYRHLDHRVLDLLLHIKDIVAQHIFTNVKVLDITANPSLEIKGLALLGALIIHSGVDAFREVGLVAKVVYHPLIVEVDCLFKDSRIGIEGNRCTVRPVGFALILEWHSSMATLKFNPIEASFAHYLCNEATR